MGNNNRFGAGTLIATMFFGSLSLAFLGGCSKSTSSSPEPQTETAGLQDPTAIIELSPSEKLVSILGTNDIHGGLEPVNFQGRRAGGMAMWSGTVKALRVGIAKRYGSGRAGTLLVDAGDQYQGTLLSNFDEGQVIFRAMDFMDYDAAVIGNHGYDFGPIGWDKDAADAIVGESKKREVLTKLVGQVGFPIISANTYFRNSIKDITGAPIQARGDYCQPEVAPQEDSGTPFPTPVNPVVIDWSAAKRFDLFVPYVIKKVAGVRVALIGIDHTHTATMTTITNVNDLCFADEVESYLRAREEIGDKADIFVLVMHDSGSDGSFVSKINKDGKKVDAVIAGHTHRVEKNWFDGVPVIQSGNGGRSFGRIDLVWDEATRSLNSAKTRAFAGVMLYHSECDAKESARFCKNDTVQRELGPMPIPRYEGELAWFDGRVIQWIKNLRREIDPLASRLLGEAKGRMNVERAVESPLANALSDAIKTVGEADLGFINTGGIRTSIDAGPFNYENFFAVLPFNNHAVVIEKMKRSTLLKLLLRSARTCGGYSALIPAGLKMTFERNCSGAQSNTVDEKAKLLKVELSDGTVILDSNIPENAMDPAILKRTFKVATLDFLSQGGSGYSEFTEAKVTSDLGIFRELVVSELLKNPASWEPKTDGRYTWSKP